MFEVSHDDEADDDHQEPRGDFLTADHPPYVHLIRVLPGTKVCRDVFSYPDKKGDEQERQVYRHEVFPCDRKVNFCFPE